MGTRFAEETARRARARGYTLIEVMIALVVFMVALLGLVALQKASVAGVNKGREHTAAVNIARFVMTEIQSEVASWPLTQSVASSEDLPMVALGLTTPGRWTALADGDVAAADDFRLDAYLEHSERDFYSSSQDTAPFCVHYMLTPLGPNQELIRARVRVVWPKWGYYVLEGAASAGTWDDCAWPGYDDPNGLSDRVKYSEVVELNAVLTREYTGQMVE